MDAVGQPPIKSRTVAVDHRRIERLRYFLDGIGPQGRLAIGSERRAHRVLDRVGAVGQVVVAGARLRTDLGRLNRWSRDDAAGAHDALPEWPSQIVLAG